MLPPMHERRASKQERKRKILAEREKITLPITCKRERKRERERERERGKKEKKKKKRQREKERTKAPLSLEVTMAMASSSLRCGWYLGHCQSCLTKTAHIDNMRAPVEDASLGVCAGESRCGARRRYALKCAVTRREGLRACVSSNHKE
jgi:hypothetical protein